MRRRDLLGTLGAACFATSGCLRLTDDQQATATASQQDGRSTESGSQPTEPTSETGTDTASADANCRTDSLPTDLTETVPSTFVDGRNSKFLPDRRTSAERPCIGWKREYELSYYGRRTDLVLGRDHIVLGQRNNDNITAISRADGSVSWRSDDTIVDSYRFVFRFGLHDGAVVVAGVNERTDDWEVLGLDSRTGERQWTVTPPVGDGRFRGLVLGPRYGYVLADGGRSSEFTDLYAIDLDSQAIAWDRTILDRRFEDPKLAADGDLFVVASDHDEGGTVQAVDGANGEPLWSRSLDIGEAVPVIGDEHVYVPANRDDQDSVEALARADGSRAWSFELLNAPRAGVTIDDSTVYVNSDTLYAVAQSDGTPQWKYELQRDPKMDNSVDGLPICLSESLLLGSSTFGEQGLVRSVDRATGELNWTVTLDERQALTPMVADGVTYAMGVTDDREADVLTQTIYALQ